MESTEYTEGPFLVIERTEKTKIQGKKNLGGKRIRVYFAVRSVFSVNSKHNKPGSVCSVLSNLIKLRESPWPA